MAESSEDGLASEGGEITPDLLLRVQAGEAEAAAWLVKRLEPEIRRKIRIWLRIRGMEAISQLESMDVCQSVLADFFAQARDGRFDLDDPDRVVGLLITMAKNKLSTRLRDRQRQKRDSRRTGPITADPIDSKAKTASRILAGRELWQAFRERLGPDELQIADLREERSSWAEIAARLGGSAEARRKQWERAVERIAAELEQA